VSIEPSLVPDFGLIAGQDPNGSGSCAGANNILIPCFCPPNREKFIDKVNSAVASGNFLGTPVTFNVDPLANQTKTDSTVYLETLSINSRNPLWISNKHIVSVSQRPSKPNMPKAINVDPYVDPYVVFNAFAQHCQVSLIDFAKAGLATAVPIQPSYATREWCTDEKKIEDHFRYVRYQYKWDSKEYIVYFTAWKDVFQPQSRMFYILSLGDRINTDALIEAVGKWTSQPHEEVFVFDRRLDKEQGALGIS
jgi:hypothetical protein